MSPHIEETPCACASDCKRFDRKAVMPVIERKYAQIAKDIEGFPLDIIADLLSNPVGSEKALAAVRKAIDYSKSVNTRFLLSAADLEIVLDTFRPDTFHVAANRGLIHPHGRLRGVMSKAADSPCAEYFSEQKLSGTTALKEVYLAVRVGESLENIISVIRGSKTSAPV
jgi:hypothetical protein